MKTICLALLLFVSAASALNCHVGTCDTPGTDSSCTESDCVGLAKYCLKITTSGGTPIRSCSPLSGIGGATGNECKTVGDVVTCQCNDKDLCNGVSTAAPYALLAAAACLLAATVRRLV